MKNIIKIVLIVTIFSSCDRLIVLSLNQQETYSLSCDCGKVRFRAAIFGSNELLLDQSFFDGDWIVDNHKLATALNVEPTNRVAYVENRLKKAFLKEDSVRINGNDVLGTTVQFKQRLERGLVIKLYPHKYIRCANGGAVSTDSIMMRF